MTKTELTLRCRAMLARGPGSLSEEDELFLLTEVFPRHPDWTEKQGAGVRNVVVGKHGLYNSVGFFLVRADGSQIDISYKVSISGRGTVRGQVVGAARNEISGQIGEWKLANPGPTGDHCDHVEPFDGILAAWCAQVGLDLDEIGVVSKLVGFQDLFSSRDLALSWQRYHRKVARYQWLTAEANIQKSNKPDPWIEAYDRAQVA